MAAAPLVWLNGFPGTGKCTITKHLISLLGNKGALLIDNHQLIDPVEAEIARSHPEYKNVRQHPDYQARRQEKRRAVLEQYVENPSMLSTIIIFTDFQSHNDLGQAVAMEYINAARRSGRLFLPVNMTCKVEENMRRVVSVERQRSTSGKLLDAETLKAMRRRSELLFFAEIEKFALDVTEVSPQEAAIVLRDYVGLKMLE